MNRRSDWILYYTPAQIARKAAWWALKFTLCTVAVTGVLAPHDFWIYVWMQIGGR